MPSTRARRRSSGCDRYRAVELSRQGGTGVTDDRAQVDGDLFEVVETFDDGRMVLEFTAGPMAGRRVVAFPEDQCLPPVPLRRERRLTPFQRAEELLLSLLSPEQGASWRRTKRFWVETPYGMIQFGEISNMLFKCADGRKLRLCVVPEDHGFDLPLPDVWVNLLLAIAVDPEGFFRVANWSPRRGEWFFGPVPGLDGQARLI